MYVRLVTEPYCVLILLFLKFSCSDIMDYAGETLKFSYQLPDGQTRLQVTTITRRWIDSAVGTEVCQLTGSFSSLSYCHVIAIF